MKIYAARTKQSLQAKIANIFPSLCVICYPFDRNVLIENIDDISHILHSTMERMRFSL